MSQIFERGPTAPKMNMTPLIDVTFQLIVFFMLVNTIASDQILPIVLPELDDPQTIKLGEVDKVIVNLGTPDSDRPIGERGLATSGDLTRMSIGSEHLEIGQFDQITRVLTKVRQKNPDVEVLLRADAALYFADVQPVMEAISEANVQKVNMVAYMEDDL